MKKIFMAHPRHSRDEVYSEIIEVPALEYYGRGYQDIYTRKPSIAKARKLLDWEPRIDLETSLTRTIYSFLEENEADPGSENRC
jgi:UDP-4-amino-4-deoxy-L-arabinose formyltransferase/UDP-glucuronic acid dehydrogenase (UDP-4-keto-hexauronic acid decarboxylating)